MNIRGYVIEARSGYAPLYVFPGDKRGGRIPAAPLEKGALPAPLILSGGQLGVCKASLKMRPHTCILDVHLEGNPWSLERDALYFALLERVWSEPGVAGGGGASSGSGRPIEVEKGVKEHGDSCSSVREEQEVGLFAQRYRVDQRRTQTKGQGDSGGGQH
jgi:hypothetical protein